MIEPRAFQECVMITVMAYVQNKKYMRRSMDHIGYAELKGLSGNMSKTK